MKYLKLLQPLTNKSIIITCNHNIQPLYEVNKIDHPYIHSKQNNMSKKLDFIFPKMAFQEFIFHLTTPKVFKDKTHMRFKLLIWLRKDKNIINEDKNELIENILKNTIHKKCWYASKSMNSYLDGNSTHFILNQKLI